jgi:hypothetical protein
VRVVPLGRPYETITSVGPFAEVEVHQRHEVMLYYHSQPPGVRPAMAAAPMGAPASVAGAPAVQQASAVSVQPGPANSLPAQPVPVGP